MNDATMWSFDPGSSGVLAPGRWLSLRAVLWTVLLSAGAFAFFESTQYLGSWLHLPQNSSYSIVLGIPILAFVVYALVVRVAERRSPVEVLPSARTVSDILIGAAIDVVMLSITTAMLWALGLYQIKPNHLKHAFDSFVFDSYLSGMMEELLFRAILLRILARAFGPRWGLALSAVAFGLAHLSHGSWLPVLEITIDGGLTLGLLYMVTGRLWMAIGMHTAWDFFEESFLGVNTHNGFSTQHTGTRQVRSPDRRILRARRIAVGDDGWSSLLRRHFMGLEEGPLQRTAKTTHTRSMKE